MHQNQEACVILISIGIRFSYISHLACNVCHDDEVVLFFTGSGLADLVDPC